MTRRAGSADAKRRARQGTDDPSGPRSSRTGGNSPNVRGGRSGGLPSSGLLFPSVATLAKSPAALRRMREEEEREQFIEHAELLPPAMPQSPRVEYLSLGTYPGGTPSRPSLPDGRGSARVRPSCPRPSTLARRTDPPSSHLAARRSSAFVCGHEARILDVLRQAPKPLTAKEIGWLCGLTNVQVCRRLGRKGRLRREGWVESVPSEDEQRWRVT